MNKNKVSDMAKDFGLTSKDILSVLSTYEDGSKKPSQVLSADEVNLIFEHLTQKHQVKIESIYAESAPKKKPHQEEPQSVPAAKAKSAEKSESKRPIGAVRHGRTRAEREKAHRAAEKQRAAKRFAHSRPVKKGKGSIKKDSKQRSQHTEVQ